MKRVYKGIVTLMCACSVLVGCSSKEELPVVSVAQIVEHKSLNLIRDSFTKQMEALGYRDGENITLVYKDAGNQISNLDTIMSTFEGNGSDVIVAIATPTAMAAAKYSERIPVVFSAVSDPLEAKLMDNLEKPNHNITGTSDEVQVDQILDLALMIDPDLKTLGFLYNTAEANSISNLKKAKAYCKERGIELREASGTNISELQAVANVLVSECDAIFAPNDNTVASSIYALVATANKHKVPVYTGADSMVSDGGFASVGIDYTKLGEETANMVDQILKGKKPSELPVKVFKDNLNIYVNETTMKELGIELPKEIAQSKRLVRMQ